MVGQEWRGSERNNGGKREREREIKSYIPLACLPSMLITANTLVLYVRETSGTEECGRRWQRGSVQ
jgi:hypothetical protein